MIKKNIQSKHGDASIGKRKRRRPKVTNPVWEEFPKAPIVHPISTFKKGM